MKARAATFVLALWMAVSMGFYVQRILIPYQRADAVAHDRPRGNLSDLYPRWLGARELLLHGRDPYGREVTREIQAGYYGRPLDPQRPADPIDQQGFAYPVYVVFLLAPTVNLPFPLVQAGFRWLLFLLTAASVVVWLGFVRWRPACLTVGALVLVTLGSFPALQGIKLQQLSFLVSAFIAIAALLLSRGYLVPAGILLALAGIKPQLALPIAGWWLLWVFGDWQRRQKLMWSFFGTVAVLMAASHWILPGWLARFRDAVAAYRVYTGGAGSLLDVLVSPAVGRPLAVLLVLAVVHVGWRGRRGRAGTEEFVSITALVLTATVIIIPMVAPYNQILLLPALLLCLSHWDAFRDRGGAVRMLTRVAGAIVFWPWLAASVLMVLSLFLAPATIQKAWAAPLYTSFWVPLAVLALQLVLLKTGNQELGTPN